jgi:serine protease Do
MKTFLKPFLSLFLTTLFSLSPLGLKPTSVWALDFDDGFSKVAQKVLPSVVAIQVKKKSKSGTNTMEEEFLKHFFGHQFRGRGTPQQKKQEGQGSGFILSEDGLILTNNHVVGGADEITVKLQDGRSLDAELVGTDDKSDVAVIRVKGDHLKPLKVGSSDNLSIGNWVIAVGNPFGLSATLTVGVVSAKGRANMGITDYEDFIQTDAAINPGNSGGPLLNAKGEVIGINTAIYSRSGGYMGIGFAIPIQMALKIKDQLVQYGEVQRGKIGAYIQELTPEVAQYFGLNETQKGVLIAELMQGGPGDKGGLKSGDVVLKLNGKVMDSSAYFRNRIALTPPGTQVELLILRDQKEKKLTVKIEPLNPSLSKKKRSKPTVSSTPLGITVESLTRKERKQLELPRSKGVMITNVIVGSVGERAGLQEGMLILSVDRTRIKSQKEFKRAIKKAGRQILVRVLDQRGIRFLVVKR